MVDGIGRIFLGGPPIVKAALGEIIEPDDLGGAQLHTYTSGVSDYLAQSEREAYGKLREICETTSRRRIDERQPWVDWRPDVEPPAHDIGELYGVISADDRIPFEAIEIIARLVDGSRFHEFKPDWGESIVTGFARIHGHLVGIIANNGIIFSESALKATHFIELCEQRRVPLVFLQNTSGYMVGRDSEAGRHRQERRQDGRRRRQCHRAPLHRADRRRVRRRQLRHVRARLPAPLPVRLAELAHRHDVGRDRRDRAGRHPPRRHEGRRDDRRARSPSSAPKSATSTRRSRIRTTPRVACGTTA